MTSNEPSKIVEAFYSALAANDGAAVAEIINTSFAADATVHLPESLPYGGTLSGRATLAKALGGMASMPKPFGPTNLVVADLIARANGVVARVEFDWYAPGSDTSVPSQALELWTFSDGIVQSMRAFYWDTAALV